MEHFLLQLLLAAHLPSRNAPLLGSRVGRVVEQSQTHERYSGRYRQRRHKTKQRSYYAEVSCQLISKQIRWETITNETDHRLYTLQSIPDT